MILSSSWSLGLSAFVAALAGGNAIAGERADRSAEFLATLPVSRARILAPKVTLASLALLAFWLIDLLALYLTVASAQVDEEACRNLRGTIRTVVPLFGVSAVLAFGAGWLFSALRASPAIATALAMIAPVALAMVSEAFIEALGAPPIEGRLWSTYVACGPPLGVAAFVAGTLHYLRRVEP